jgi:hypothetical protein
MTTQIKLPLMEYVLNVNLPVKLVIYLQVNAQGVLTTCYCSEDLVYSIALENGNQMI